jgi:hypothetical protein
VGRRGRYPGRFPDSDAVESNLSLPGFDEELHITLEDHGTVLIGHLGVEYDQPGVVATRLVRLRDRLATGLRRIQDAARSQTISGPLSTVVDALDLPDFGAFGLTWADDRQFVGVNESTFARRVRRRQPVVG